MRLRVPIKRPSHSNAHMKKESSPLTAALESRNDEQATADRNQVFDQSNVEIRLAQGLYDPSAGLIAAKTTDDASEHSQPSTKESRLSTTTRNPCAGEATCHDAGDEPNRSSAIRSIRQLINKDFCDGCEAQNYYCRKRADERHRPRKSEPTQVHGPRDGGRRRK